MTSKQLNRLLISKAVSLAREMIEKGYETETAISRAAAGYGVPIEAVRSGL